MSFLLEMDLIYIIIYRQNIQIFLHVAEYLVNHSYESAKTIGDILSQEVLQKNDDFIKLCYDTHKTVFDNILFDKEKIEEMATTVKGNM